MCGLYTSLGGLYIGLWSHKELILAPEIAQFVRIRAYRSTVGGNLSKPS